MSLLHRHIATEHAADRIELVDRVRTAIRDADDWDGTGDFITHMAEASVDAFVAFYREKQYRPPA